MNHFKEKQIGLLDVGGMSLIEMMIATAMVATLALIGAGVTANLAQQERKNSILEMLSQKKMVIMNSVSTDASWSSTLTENSVNNARGVANLSCMTTTLGCAGVGKPTPFDLFDATGNLVVLSSPANSAVNAVNGFNTDGTVCVGTANNKCAVGVTITWTPQCPSAAQDPKCNRPFIQVNVQYKLDPALGLSGINLSPYQPNPGRLALFWTPCAPSQAPKNCTAKQQAICSANGWICAALPGPCVAQTNVPWLSCVGNIPYTVNNGVTPPVYTTNGNIGSATFKCIANSFVLQAGATCAPPPPSNCPPGAQSWAVSGTTCSGPTPMIASGQNFTTTSNVGGTGSLTVQCSGGVLTQISGFTCAAVSQCSQNPTAQGCPCPAGYSGSFPTCVGPNDGCPGVRSSLNCDGARNCNWSGCDIKYGGCPSPQYSDYDVQVSPPPGVTCDFNLNGSVQVVVSGQNYTSSNFRVGGIAEPTFMSLRCTGATLGTMNGSSTVNVVKVKLLDSGISPNPKTLCQ